jgi:phosphopantetheine adenylyltransferase
VSKIYSKLWDEAVQCNLFDIDSVVLNDKDDIQAALNQCYKRSDLSAVYYYREDTRKNIMSSMQVDSSSNSITYVSNNEICDKMRKCFMEQERIFSFDLSNSLNDDITYSHVALGGTFDRLHNGHRKLLTLAAAICARKITIGITGTSMLTKKSGAHLITSFEERCNGVRNFMLMIKPHLECNIVALEDSYGPTITDPDIDVIVVSSETIRGAFQINQIRREKLLKPLAVGVSLRSDAAVLSSSFLRDKLMTQK